VKRLTSYVWNADLSESLARDSVSENTEHAGERQNDDAASDELQLLDCWTYLDVDDDGIAELRHYLLAGNEILENEEAPEIPWESWTPIPIPHRHVGLGIYEIIEDLQRIKTALQRGLLDNTYFGNNRRLAYNQNTVNVQMLQINRPGGHIAVDGPPAGQIAPIEYTPIANHILPVIDYVDTVKETRTGVGRLTQGVDADVLAQSTKGAYQDARGSANQRIEAIARIFAETGLSSLYRSLHGLLMRHQDWPTKFKLRNDWVQTNPADWQERTDLTVSVGLGNASKEEIRANIQLMGVAQEKAGMVPGLVQPQNVFALFKRFQTELGFENENFITDPQSPEYEKFQQSQQGQKDPFVQGEEIKAQANMAGKQLDAQIKREQMAQDRDLKITEMEVSAGVDLAKAGIGAEVAVARGNQQASRNGAAAAGEPAPSGGG
jgi:predicted transcriptional regulator